MRDRLRMGDERFAITGSTGWLGRTALNMFSELIGADAMERRVVAFAHSGAKITVRDGCVMRARALDELPALRPHPTHILHFAYPTQDRVTVLGPEMFWQQIADIDSAIIRTLTSGQVSGLFFASSGAACRPEKVNSSTDHYGIAKRFDEKFLQRASSDTGTRSVIARLFSVSGPHMNKRQFYALGDFITQVRRGGPVKVHAQGLVRRSYAAASDVVSVALAELLDPSSSAVLFETGGEEIIEIGDLAARVCVILGRPDLRIDRSLRWDNPPDDYFGDVSSIRRLSDRHRLNLLSLDEQIRQSARGWL